MFLDLDYVVGVLIAALILLSLSAVWSALSAPLLFFAGVVLAPFLLLLSVVFGPLLIAGAWFYHAWFSEEPGELDVEVEKKQRRMSA